MLKSLGLKGTTAGKIAGRQLVIHFNCKQDIVHAVQRSQPLLFDFVDGEKKKNFVSFFFLCLLDMTKRSNLTSLNLNVLMSVRLTLMYIAQRCLMINVYRNVVGSQCNILIQKATDV